MLKVCLELFVFSFQQLSKILDDPEASSNDRFVALELLKNANIAAGMILPGCQDTGTAIVMGKYVCLFTQYSIITMGMTL